MDLSKTVSTELRNILAYPEKTVKLSNPPNSTVIATAINFIKNPSAYQGLIIENDTDHITDHYNSTNGVVTSKYKELLNGVNTVVESRKTKSTVRVPTNSVKIPIIPYDHEDVTSYNSNISDSYSNGHDEIISVPRIHGTNDALLVSGEQYMCVAIRIDDFANAILQPKIFTSYYKFSSSQGYTIGNLRRYLSDGINLLLPTNPQIKNNMGRLNTGYYIAANIGYIITGIFFPAIDSFIESQLSDHDKHLSWKKGLDTNITVFLDGGKIQPVIQKLL